VSLRPRYAGTGWLRLPVDVEAVEGEDHVGAVEGRFGPDGWDPFERTRLEDLLVAESFTRGHLERPDQVRLWYQLHGALDIEGLFPRHDTQIPAPVRLVRFRDRLADVLDAQALVRWHLETLVRLTDGTEIGEQERDLFPALRHPRGGVLWLGGADDHERRITAEMAAYPRFEDRPGGGGRDEAQSWNLGPISVAEFLDTWWPRAHFAWQRITSHDVKVVPVPPGAWARAWAAYDQVWGVAAAGSSPLPMVAHDRSGLLEVARRLIEPYVQKASVTNLELGGGSDGDEAGVAPFEVVERREWRSALVPIHLQLLEAYRRVSEGLPGAARCRECGNPILALDPRRTAFCNDRERFRFAQRERRKRLAMPPADRGTPP
jgi:hypothetical protein